MLFSGPPRGNGALQQWPQVLRVVRAEGLRGRYRRGEDRPLLPRPVRRQLRAGDTATRPQPPHVLQVAQKDSGLDIDHQNLGKKLRMST